MYSYASRKLNNIASDFFSAKYFGFNFNKTQLMTIAMPTEIITL